MSLFDKWRAIHKTRFLTNPTQELLADREITSHQMIFYLADVCGVAEQTVSKVIDDFWGYVSDATNHNVKSVKHTFCVDGRSVLIPYQPTLRALSDRRRFPRAI